MSANGKDGVTLNLADASIAEAAKSVLGDALGLNYAVSEKVKGTITIQTTKAVPKDALLEIFETVLRGEGAAIVAQQDIYRIVPTSDAIGSAPHMGKGRRTRGQHPRCAVAIRGGLPRWSAFSGDSAQCQPVEDRHEPQLAGRRRHPRRPGFGHGLGERVRCRLDARHVASASIPSKRGTQRRSPRSWTRFSPTTATARPKGIVRFVPNRRLKSILVISSRPEYLRRAQAWLRRLDLATRATVKQVFVYPCEAARPARLAQLLQKVYGSQEQAKLAPKLGAPPPALVLHPRACWARCRRRRRHSRRRVGRRSRSTSAGTGNSVVRWPQGRSQQRHQRGCRRGEQRHHHHGDRAGVQSACIQILDRIDVAPNQVLLEATIAEVRLNDDLKMGVRWFFQAGNHQLKFTDSPLGALGATFPGFSNFYQVPNVQMVFNALSTITDINIVSSPTLMVLDNKKATLQVGNEVPIATQSAVAVLTPGSPIVNSITYRSTGIVLNITPRIGDGGRVLLDVEQEASDVVATDDVRHRLPTIQQRRIKTTVAVNDGEGVVPRGMIRTAQTTSVTRFP